MAKSKIMVRKPDPFPLRRDFQAQKKPRCRIEEDFYGCFDVLAAMQAIPRAILFPWFDHSLIKTTAPPPPRTFVPFACRVQSQFTISQSQPVNSRANTSKQPPAWHHQANQISAIQTRLPINEYCRNLDNLRTLKLGV